MNLMRSDRLADVRLICCALLFTTAVYAAEQITLQSIPPAHSDTLSFRVPLQDFEAKDLNEHTWRREDLIGKYTVVVVWSTWCLPCREEQPILQQFYDETKTALNIQVLTFSLDDYPPRVRTYLKTKGYSFPTIADPALERKIFPTDGGIPMIWVIDPNGRRSEVFRAWKLGRVLLEVEQAADRR